MYLRPSQKGKSGGLRKRQQSQLPAPQTPSGTTCQELAGTQHRNKSGGTHTDPSFGTGWG